MVVGSGKPDGASSSPSNFDRQVPENDRDYVLAALSYALAWHRLQAAEAEMIDIALRNDWVSATDAVIWARDIGIVHLVGSVDEGVA